MYGQYPIVIDLNESVAEINMILSAIKGIPFNRDVTLQACAHYKHLALVCACAFMMSPIAMNLRDPQKRASVRKVLSEHVEGIYPMFATERMFWGYQETITVVTELAFSFVQTILFFVPNLINGLGVPHQFTIVPIKVGYLEDMHADSIAHLSHKEQNQVLKTIDEQNLKGRLPEPKSKMSFTLWVRPPAGAKLLS